ncbi:cell adhesion molecule Dscam1-like [Amphiura filiformis]|uniref:cell adhesion molecule Dscam1-like n=1 Tax=Amphiura filiformis TaxID=82378 RepID=UPI003B215488
MTISHVIENDKTSCYAFDQSKRALDDEYEEANSDYLEKKFNDFEEANLSHKHRMAWDLVNEISDIDECSNSNLNACDPNANCTNTDGSYYCTCLDGFRGNGETCEDIDECTENTPCLNGATCNDYDGSYDCVCVPGWEGDNCESDIDECTTNTDNCDPNASCTDTEGSFDCKCNDGYYGNGVICTTPGRIINGDIQVEADLGVTTDLDCTVYGNTDPQIAWYNQNGIGIDGTEDKYDIIPSQHSDLFTTRVLRIFNIERGDNGSYTCNITNTINVQFDDLRYDSAEYALLVLESPLIAITTLEAQDNETIRVSWAVTFTGNLPLDRCTVEYQQDGDVDWMVATNQAIGEDLSYDITGLMPYTFYDVRLMCNNSVGNSNQVETVTPERTGEYFPGPPQDVQLDNIMQTSVRVSWMPPEVTNGAIDGYIIELESNNGNVERESSMSPFIVDNLSPGTNYNVYVTAVNRESIEFVGNRSDVVTFKTLPDAPSPPINVKAADFSDTCTITWDAPAVPNGIITQYTVYPVSQRRGDDPDPVDEDPVIIENTERTIYTFIESDLIPYSRYDYTVTASTSFGEGEQSSPAVSCLTEPDKPNQPPQIEPLPEETPDIVTQNTFKLMILPPDTRNGDVSCYEVIIVPLVKGDAYDPNVDPDVVYPPDSIQSYDESKARPGNPYLAMVLKGSSITDSQQVTIGDKSETSCDDTDVGSNRRKRAVPETRQATNGPVQAGTDYTAFTRSYVLVGDQVVFDSSPILAAPIRTSRK